MKKIVLLIICLGLVGCRSNSLQAAKDDLPNSASNNAITPTAILDNVSLPTTTSSDNVITSDTTSDDTKSNNSQEVDTLSNKVMASSVLQLTDEDFEVKYNSVTINKATNYLDIVKQLGYPDDHEAYNNGFISGNAGLRRWNLCYPLHESPEIRMIILSERVYTGEEVSDGSGYIVGVYLESYITARGLRVGDSIDKVLALYGRPESFGPSEETEGKLNRLRYTKGEEHIDITLDEDKDKVQYIFIDYNAEKSIKDQGIEE